MRSTTGSTSAGGAGELGSASILVVGIVIAIALIAGTLVPLYMGFSARGRTEGAADAAALAGADVAAGLYPGDPCTIAASIAATNASVLDACEVDGLVVTVRTKSEFLGIPLTAIATAGPPTKGTN